MRLRVSAAFVLPGEELRKPAWGDRDPAVIEAGTDLPAPMVPAIELVVPEEVLRVAFNGVDADTRVIHELDAVVVAELVAVAVGRSVGRRTVSGVDSLPMSAILVTRKVTVRTRAQQGQWTEQQEEGKHAPEVDSGRHEGSLRRTPD